MREVTTVTATVRSSVRSLLGTVPVSLVPTGGVRHPEELRRLYLSVFLQCFPKPVILLVRLTKVKSLVGLRARDLTRLSVY